MNIQIICLLLICNLNFMSRRNTKFKKKNSTQQSQSQDDWKPSTSNQHNQNYQKTTKGRQRKSKYQNTNKGKQRKLNYEKTEQGKQKRHNYDQTQEGKQRKLKYDETQGGKQRKMKYEKTQEGKQRKQKYQNTYRGRQQLRQIKTWRIALEPNVDDINQNYLGAMSKKCPQCNALHFQSQLKRKLLCCSNGTIQFEEKKSFPQQIRILFTQKSSQQSKNFLRFIRRYNNSLGFVSFGSTLMSDSNQQHYRPNTIQSVPGRGPFTLRISGYLTHCISTFVPKDQDKAKYSQLYFYDPDIANQIRLKNSYNSQLEKKILEKLESFLRAVNPYAKQYLMLKQTLKNNDVSQQYVIVLKQNTKRDKLYDLPTANQIAGIYKLQDLDSDQLDKDLIIYSKSQKRFKKLSYKNKYAIPMTYVLLFPFGQLGWDPYLKKKNGKHLTIAQYASTYFAIRQQFSPILHASSLLQQFAIDLNHMIQINDLNYLRYNKKIILKYQGQNKQSCQKIILPKTYYRSDKFYQELYQDSMALVRKYGKPDLFITITTNPNWREIRSNLFPGQQPSDRPDLIVRVFYAKLNEIIEEITKKQIFGQVTYYFYTIEFQKRGLPHAHLLVCLNQNDKPGTNIETINKMVSTKAKVQNESLQNKMKHMLHGKCGLLNPKAPCMAKGTCAKKYPKSKQNQTSINTNGYPAYRREYQQDRWVIPYNPYLLCKYDCHINIEVCSGIRAIKYLHKYVTKGSDKIEAGFQNPNNQINRYVNGRYVTSCDALWKILHYQIYDRSHSIINLTVHLEGQKPIYIFQGQEIQDFQLKSSKKSMLQAYFDLNTTDEQATKYLYEEIPQHYIFQKNQGKWRPRERVIKVISRLYNVSMKNTELFCLRQLLRYKKGPKSFKEIKIINEIQYETFREAAIASNLFQNDKQFRQVLTQMASYKMPFQMRRLFAYIIIFNNIINALQLWQQFKQHMRQDYQYQGYSTYESNKKALQEISTLLKQGGKDAHKIGLDSQKMRKRLFQDSYVKVTIQQNNEQCDQNERYATLNEKQKIAFNQIIQNIGNNKLYFINGPAGTGKTYLYNALISYLKAKFGMKIAVMATTGIAATLLPNGITVHKMFGIPIPLFADTHISIKKQSEQYFRLRTIDAFIIDEASGLNKNSLSYINKKLKMIHQTDQLFGGKLIILGGDFRQTLPIIENGSKAETLQNCIKNSYLWRYFQTLKLTQNMRCDKDQKEFARYLLEVGDGINGNFIKINKQWIINNVVQQIYGQMNEDKNKIILAVTNQTVHKINSQILKKLPEKQEVFIAEDKIQSEIQEESQFNEKYSIEFLNSLEIPGLPLYKLILKIGSTIMLLRNLNVIQGLSNGTRMRIKQIKKYTLLCEILTGNFIGKIVAIPKIKNISNTNQIPFKLCRYQFPVSLCFCMTINKSQGQTFDQVGIFFDQNVFTHGQMYVALSRVRNPQHLYMQVSEGILQLDQKGDCFLRNIVFQEILFQQNQIPNNHEIFQSFQMKKDPHNLKTIVEEQSWIKENSQDDDQQLRQALAQSLLLNQQKQLQITFSRAIMVQYLRNFNMNLQQILGDGNCLYRAISFQISGSQDNWIQVKADIVKELQMNKNQFRQQILLVAQQDQIQGTQQQMIKLYIEQVKKRDRYGTQFQLLVASKVFGCGFLVHQINGQWILKGERINGSINSFTICHRSVILMNTNCHHLIFENFYNRMNHWESVIYNAPLEEINHNHFDEKIERAQ